MPTMKPYNVIFSCLNPVEGRLVLDAENEQEAERMAMALLADRYKDPRVVKVYEFEAETMIEPDVIVDMPDKKAMN